MKEIGISYDNTPIIKEGDFHKEGWKVCTPFYPI